MDLCHLCREVLEDGTLPGGVNISFAGHGQVHMQVKSSALALRACLYLRNSLDTGLN